MIHDYLYLVIPIVAVVTSQVVKLATDGIKGNLDIKRIFETYGGMPSSHAAFVGSLATIVALEQGITTPLFGTVFVFGVLVLRDALGLRHIISRQNQTLNALHKDAQLPERIHHTLVEVIAGLVLGFVIALVFRLG
ncbi:MAG: divergent PAP2 family protein [Parcubacteria group bacterium CG08_land_8_20_14_0_20_48_21]|nr:MAG: hypothetical protein AUK21_02160 [Parcubacteria group bacterium CG2_30_48_51]PIS33036.1 MAG: divergent PAP2 family protein [Parcubacteria group bacterium CG08_land_8_20_14_0_20_48_21]PIW79113.1 MAG: divergent PAP2 family protein [Parcubacteria group bacterium CG_4_8_14_3_um_filter_48_16]PIY78208.1 MAG: divergent PAP2 family protein [Parcubacteria group bacterium CG_4_10_14_0_8_um_filter_48_154]PIZ78054.1 MAG: divergent PAP2 family protein [bacterium CG_4_10_14_0_2_um_filter_48_144]PJC4